MTKLKNQKVSFEEYQERAKELSDKYPAWKRILDYSVSELKEKTFRQENFVQFN
tara:strand:+ start:296 stop:457 length:162 start_codon:yes stop_codon:yes gene_type:complete